ncbi:hypothetical protein EK904_000567 [Melospiza melodia maxima]|nr:hypothetical protein EK904_000567 [Melospiza melodia maxima]
MRQQYMPLVLMPLKIINGGLVRRGSYNLIKAILSATKDYRLTPALDSLSCRRCIIVGNGGVLANKSLGLKIDDYDVVVRLNSAPVKGFEKDVGGKTTLRITYPEGAIQKMEQYEKDSLFVLAGFKWQDFKWLKYIVYKEKVAEILLSLALAAGRWLTQLHFQEETNAESAVPMEDEQCYGNST